MERRCRRHESGFTLIELILTMSIIGVMTMMGMLQFKESRDQQNLERAAWELAADIRWMQQLSANDTTARYATNPNYVYRLRLWSATYNPVVGDPATTTNSYVVLNGTTVMKQLNFSDYQVSAQVVPNLSTVDMTFFAYDLDRVNNITNNLENASYQIKLTNIDNNAVRYVTVDSRVGRVRVAATPP
jgi:prepilin-type N-terminal cleavage/methylation domain-containing protein